MSALRWRVKTGRWQRVAQGVYLEGGEPPTPFERALATVIVTGGVASFSLAGILHGLDGVELAEPYATVKRGVQTSRPGVRSRALMVPAVAQVQGFRCTTGLQTIVDLAEVLDDDHWEQALESALRKRLMKLDELHEALPRLGQARTPGVARIRRVLRLRPEGAPPTESLLETLMVQLIRSCPRLPEPTRQVEVFNRWNEFIARVDLAWPERGVFIELDGQHHLGQPVHDARRQTAVVAATGWLPGRFTWREVTRVPKATALRCVELLAEASRKREIA